MTSRELVRRALEFEKPERIPRHLWLLPWANLHFPQEVAELQKKFPDFEYTYTNYVKPLMYLTFSKERGKEEKVVWDFVYENKLNWTKQEANLFRKFALGEKSSD